MVMSLSWNMPLQGRLSEWEKKDFFSGITVEYADTINELSLEHAFATYFECII